MVYNMEKRKELGEHMIMDSWKQFLSGISIKKQLNISIILLSIIPLLLVSFFAQYFTTQSANTYIYNLSEQIVTKGANNTNALFRSIQHNLEAVIIDPL